MPRVKAPPDQIFAEFLHTTGKTTCEVVPVTGIYPSLGAFRVRLFQKELGKTGKPTPLRHYLTDRPGNNGIRYVGIFEEMQTAKRALTLSIEQNQRIEDGGPAFLTRLTLLQAFERRYAQRGGHLYVLMQGDQVVMAFDDKVQQLRPLIIHAEAPPEGRSVPHNQPIMAPKTPVPAAQPT